VANVGSAGSRFVAAHVTSTAAILSNTIHFSGDNGNDVVLLYSVPQRRKLANPTGSTELGVARVIATGARQLRSNEYLKPNQY